MTAPHDDHPQGPTLTELSRAERATETFMGQPALNARFDHRPQPLEHGPLDEVGVTAPPVMRHGVVTNRADGVPEGVNYGAIQAGGQGPVFTTRPLPSVCPTCGAYSLAPEGSHSALLAVCDVLVHKALEAMGKYIVRAERSRYRDLGTRPMREAHTVWQATDAVVEKALRGAWDVVPALLDVHGCCDVTSLQVSKMLDDYVHDLVITGTKHDVDELIYRFSSVLGMPVFRRG